MRLLKKSKVTLLLSTLVALLIPLTIYALNQRWELRREAAPASTTLTYPTDKWERIWYEYQPEGEYVQGQKPDAYIELPMGAAGELQFDENDNLIVQDHTWPRAWVINLDKDPSWLKPVSTTADPTQLWFYSQTPNVLKIFGQKDYKEISEDTTVANKIHHAAGVIVDTSITPNRIYAVDSGNNRILGFASLGTCSNNSSKKCTNDLDCPGSTCSIDGQKSPDLIFGQPQNESGPELSAACNRDANLGIYATPSADTLCFIHTPGATNMGEYWMRHNFDVDLQGNLYVLDPHNNRVLKYNQPFSADKSGGKGDAVADFVIGQDNFTSGDENKGRGTNPNDPNVRDNSSLYTSMGGPDHVSARGVSVDGNDNVWVADTFNGRVLRFPPGSKQADLVLGQDGFNSTPFTTCYDPRTAPLNKMCTPTLAKINPETGWLYVADEYPSGFKARILVFKPPFANGMSAEKAIFANQDKLAAWWPNQGGITSCADQHTRTACGTLGGESDCWWRCEDPDPSKCETIGTCFYRFTASGFEFNTFRGEYANGVLWVNENQRTILIDNDGNILKVLGAPDKYRKGCDGKYYARCTNGGSLENNFGLCWPGGAIGFDNANNIYLADEHYNRIDRFALPYNIHEVTTSWGESAPHTYTCIPEANGGLFAGTRANSVTPYGTSGSIGVFAFQNQLILKDQSRLLVWNDYLNKPMGAGADFVIDQSAAYDKYGEGKNPFQLGGRSFHIRVDDKNRLWMTNTRGQIIVFQLPLHQGDQPLANSVKLFWADDQTTEVNYYTASVAFDKANKKIWISDYNNNRLLRVSNYNDFQSKLYIDMVIGQPGKDSVCCNQMKKPDGTCESEVKANDYPRAETLCMPYQIEFDNYGNLYVVENNYECHGNDRIIMFTAEDLKSASGLFPNTRAAKVFVSKGLTEGAQCNSEMVNEPFSPVSIAFNSKNQMVVGNDGYGSGGGGVGERHLKQLWFYDDPLKSNIKYLGSGLDWTDLNFDNNWGLGTIAYGKTDVQFSSSRTIHIDQAGTYKFSVGSDDGVRLWVDNELVINEWRRRGYPDPLNSYETDLEAGDHRVRLDYFDAAWDARVSFALEPIAVNPPVLNVSPTGLTFTPITQGTSSAESQSTFVYNSGGGTLNWSASEGSSWFWISPPSGSSTGSLDGDTIWVTLENTSGLAAGNHTQTIFVSGQAGTQNSPQPVTVNLTVNPSCTNTAPSTPTLSSPSNGATGQSTSPTVFWNAFSDVSDWGTNCAGNNNTYEVFLDTNSNPTTSRGAVAEGTTSQSISGLSNNTTYYWKVRASNGALSSDSSVWSFATSPSAQCSALNFPSDKWQRVWSDYPNGSCLGNGPDETSLFFDTNWGSGNEIAYGRDNYLQLKSSRTIHIDTAGTYRFHIGSDDGVRFYLDDVLRLEQWLVRHYTVDTLDIPLTSGDHRLQLDYYENTGAARFSFSYEPIIVNPPALNVSPTIVNLSATQGTGTVTCTSCPIISNTGGGILSWSAPDDAPGDWLWWTPTADGNGPTTLWVSATINGLSAGSYSGAITITGAAGTQNSPQTVTVNLTIAPTTQCSSLNFPSDKWQRVWYSYPDGDCLGDGPDWEGLNFDNIWTWETNPVIAYGRDNYLQLKSSRTIHIDTAGTYRFHIGSDDGVRFYLDDMNVSKLEKWIVRHYPVDALDIFDMYLSAGDHRVELDYFENTGAARFSFSYESTACTNTAPSVTTLSSPANGATSQPTSPTVSWNAISSWGTNCAGNTNTYEVFLHSNQTLVQNSDPAASKGAVPGGTTSKPVSDLLNSTTYYWKVRASNGALSTDSAIPNWSLTTSSEQGHDDQYYDIARTPKDECLEWWNDVGHTQYYSLDTWSNGARSDWHCSKWNADNNQWIPYGGSNDACGYNMPDHSSYYHNGCTAYGKLTPGGGGGGGGLPSQLLGDLDGDCDVDIVDIMKVAAIWNTRTGDAQFKSEYDFDSNGRIDVADVMQVAAKWNTRCGE